MASAQGTRLPGCASMPGGTPIATRSVTQHLRFRVDASVSTPSRPTFGRSLTRWARLLAHATTVRVQGARALPTLRELGGPRSRPPHRAQSGRRPRRPGGDFTTPANGTRAIPRLAVSHPWASQLSQGYAAVRHEHACFAPKSGRNRKGRPDARCSSAAGVLSVVTETLASTRERKRTAPPLEYRGPVSQDDDWLKERPKPTSRNAADAV